MSSFGYPRLPRAEIISITQQLQVAAITEKDLKNPNPDFLSDLYARLLIHLDLLDEEEQGQVEFEALEQLENPDHHVESVRAMRLYTRIRELLELLHCPLNFTLKDLLLPKPDRTEIFLSAIINICLYRDQKMNLLRPIGDELALLAEQQKEWEVKISELNAEIANYNAAREEESPFVQELDAKVKELHQTIAGLNNQQMSLRATLRKMKEKTGEIEKEISNAEFNLVQSAQENATLHLKIVQSPDKLQRSLEEKKAILDNAKNAERTAMESFQKKTEILEVYTKALKKMSKHFSKLQGIQEQVNSVKSIDKDCKAVNAKLRAFEVEDKSLDAKSAALQGKAQQLDELRKSLEKERDLKCEEATKNLSNVKLEVEARRRELEARQQKVEAVLSEVDSITTKTKLLEEATATRVQELVAKRKDVIEQFQMYKKSLAPLVSVDTEA